MYPAQTYDVLSGLEPYYTWYPQTESRTRTTHAVPVLALFMCDEGVEKARAGARPIKNHPQDEILPHPPTTHMINSE
jgi:hypothetical protein